MKVKTQSPINAFTVNACPETQLLLQCARTQIEDQTAEKIRILASKEINWQFLIQTASHHRVMPLLYKNLSTICPERVPKSILIHLRQLFHSNALHNLTLTMELLKLLNLFRKNNIPAIPFKGPVLTASAYGNLALRQFGDLDILVLQKDFLNAKELLCMHGYHTMSQRFLNRKQELAYMIYRGEYNLIHYDSQLIVDLHGRLISGSLSLSANFDYFHDRLESVFLLRETILSFQAKELLIYLCIHGTKSLWQRVIWICDIAELIRIHQNLDWEQVLLQAKSLGSERMLLIGCSLANELLGTPLPTSIHRRINDELLIKSMVSQVQRAILEGDQFASNKPSFKFDFHINSMERLEDKFKYRLKILAKPVSRLLCKVFRPNSKDRDFYPLPDNLHVLYYLIRPVRLICLWAFLT